MDRSQVNEVSFKDREAPGTTQNQVISERLQAKQLLKVTGSPCASKSKETAHSAVSEGLALSIAATRAKAKTTPKKAKLKKQAPQNAEADDHDKQNVFIPPPPPLLPNPSPTAAAPAPAPVLAMAAPLPPPAIKTVKRGRMATFESLLQEDEMAEINLEVEKAAAAASVALAEATAAHGTEGPLPKVFATAHQTVITAGAKEQTGLGPKRAAVHVASIIKHVLRQTPEVMKQQQQANASSSSVHHRNIGRSILIQSKAAKGVAGIETNEDKTTTTHEKVPSNIRKVIKNIFSLAEAQKIDLHSIKEMFDRELKEHRAKTSGPVAPQAAPQAAPQVAEEARVSWIEIPFESPSPPNRYRGAAAHGGPMSSAQASAQIKPFSQERGPTWAGIANLDQDLDNIGLDAFSVPSQNETIKPIVQVVHASNAGQVQAQESDQGPLLPSPPPPPPPPLVASEQEEGPTNDQVDLLNNNRASEMIHLPSVILSSSLFQPESGLDSLLNLLRDSIHIVPRCQAQACNEDIRMEAETVEQQRPITRQPDATVALARDLQDSIVPSATLDQLPAVNSSAAEIQSLSNQFHGRLSMSEFDLIGPCAHEDESADEADPLAALGLRQAPVAPPPLIGGHVALPPFPPLSNTTSLSLHLPSQVSGIARPGHPSGMMMPPSYHHLTSFNPASPFRPLQQQQQPTSFIPPPPYFPFPQHRETAPVRKKNNNQEGLLATNTFAEFALKQKVVAEGKQGQARVVMGPPPPPPPPAVTVDQVPQPTQPVNPYREENRPCSLTEYGRVKKKNCRWDEGGADDMNDEGEGQQGEREEARPDGDPALLTDGSQLNTAGTDGSGGTGGSGGEEGADAFTRALSLLLSGTGVVRESEVFSEGMRGMSFLHNLEAHVQGHQGSHQANDLLLGSGAAEGSSPLPPPLPNLGLDEASMNYLFAAFQYPPQATDHDGRVNHNLPLQLPYMPPPSPPATQRRGKGRPRKNILGNMEQDVMELGMSILASPQSMNTNASLPFTSHAPPPPHLPSHAPLSSGLSLVSGTNQDDFSHVPIEQLKKIFTRETLSKYFHLSLEQSAEALHIGATVLKKLSRALGIEKWPHRKIQSMQKLIDKVEQDARDKPEHLETATLIFASLHKCVESLREDPTFDIPPDIKRLRQANFKVEYKSRTARGIHVPLVKGNGKKPRGRPPKPASQKKRVRNRETPSPSSESGEESGGHETGGGVDEEEEEEVNNE